MKLLLDEDLSDRIIPRIIDLYPDSAHVKQLNLIQNPDGAIWSFAAANDFVIVSKDSDFRHRSVLLGHPPKVIFLRVGNCPTTLITQLLRDNHLLITDFGDDPARGMMVLSAPNKPLSLVTS
jgi:predicted nuclease of predicted toxin-antitoxin system